jgi:hypothetical protein
LSHMSRTASGAGCTGLGGSGDTGDRAMAMGALRAGYPRGGVGVQVGRTSVESGRTDAVGPHDLRCGSELRSWVHLSPCISAPSTAAGGWQRAVRATRFGPATPRIRGGPTGDVPSTVCVSVVASVGPATPRIRGGPTGDVPSTVCVSVVASFGPATPRIRGGPTGDVLSTVCVSVVASVATPLVQDVTSKLPSSNMHGTAPPLGRFPARPPGGRQRVRRVTAV